MNELQNRCLNTFPAWLRTLGSDASDLVAVLSNDRVPADAQRWIIGSLNYLLKSLDLIPDGIEDLGFLDDAFVLRVAAALALASFPTVSEEAPMLARLAGDAQLVREFLGKDYARLERYVRTLTKGVARGRSVDEILANEQARAAFVHEATTWASEYVTPLFAHDDRTLIKLQSFLTTKLPA